MTGDRREIRVRQRQRGQVLREMLQRDHNVRVRVQERETGDVNNPGWDTTIGRHEMLLSQASTRDLQARDREYSQPLTHVAYCDDHEDLLVGSRVTITAFRTDANAWNGLSADDPEYHYIIIGRREIAGVPEPHGQVKLELHRASASTGRATRTA